MRATKPRKIKNIKNILGGFHDVASFREETKAPPAEISDAEIVLLIESDKAHLAAHRHKQQSAELYVENAKLRHLAGLPPKVIKLANPTSHTLTRHAQRKLIRPDTPRYAPQTKPATTKPATPKPAKNVFNSAHWLDQITSPVKHAGNKPIIDQLIKDAHTPTHLTKNKKVKK